MIEAANRAHIGTKYLYLTISAIASAYLFVNKAHNSFVIISDTNFNKNRSDYKFRLIVKSSWTLE